MRHSMFSLEPALYHQLTLKKCLNVRFDLYYVHCMWDQNSEHPLTVGRYVSDLILTSQSSIDTCLHACMVVGEI